MTYRVRVLTFTSPWLDTFVEVWTLLNGEVYKLSAALRIEPMVQDVCWIQLKDGRILKIDDIQNIANALGLIYTEGEGFMCQTVVPASRAMNIEPLVQGLIEQCSVQAAMRRSVLEEIEQMRQAITKKPAARLLSSEEVRAETEELANLRLQIERLRIKYEMDKEL